MIHTLMISLDSTIATDPSGTARKRHLAYARRMGRLTLITYTRAGGRTRETPEPCLTIVPTESRSRLTFALDALRCGSDAARRERIDVIATQDPFLTGLVGARLRAVTGAPLLVQNHTYIFGNREWVKEHPIRNRVLSLLGRFVLSQADMVRTVNQVERDAYIRSGGSPDRVVALPLGTASPAFVAAPDPDALAALRWRLGIVPDDKIVLWVGYPVDFKRVPLLFEVFKSVLAQVPSARLVMVGDMKRASVDLPALADSMAIAPRVTFTGNIPHDDLPLYYHLGAVYAHTSSYEGVPRVLLEASAAGLPLVGMDVVGVNEVIEDGVNGRLVPDKAVGTMAERVAYLLRHPEEAARLGAEAQRRALEKYGFEAYVESWVGVMERAVSLGKRR